MAKFKVAHLNQQGQNMVIFPLDSSYDRKTEAEQLEAMAALQACSIAAGLAGQVVVIWKSGRNTKFRAPQLWHAFFKSVTYEQIVMSINKEVTCG